MIFDSFSSTPELGEMILINRVTHATSACGVIAYSLGEEGSVFEQKVSIDRKIREERNGHRALTIWMTGLSGAGKSTLADNIERALFSSGIQTMLLVDGDNIRKGLCAGLGFDADGRKENIRRVAETSKLLNDAGITVIAAFISPFNEDRDMARKIIGDCFVEVFVNASLDAWGMYKKALRGEIRNFTGISSPFEIPINPEIEVQSDVESIETCSNKILGIIRKKIRL